MDLFVLGRSINFEKGWGTGFRLALMTTSVHHSIRKGRVVALTNIKKLPVW